MALKKFRPYTPSNRYKELPSFEEITKDTPEKSLLSPLKKSGGRNNRGRITCRHRGGGHKRKYRLVDFKRMKRDVSAKVEGIEYDPNRSARIALITYEDGVKSYIIAPVGLEVGAKVEAGENAPPKVSDKTYVASKLEFNSPQNLEEKNLLIFENNLSFEMSDFKDQKFKKVFLISNKNENRTIELSEKLVKFKSQLIEDQKKRLEEKSINTEIIDLSEIQNINETSYGLYPTVGENLDFINTNNLKIEFLYRKLDQFSWQYCNKGFFNFKNYIPKIISTLN